MKINVRRKRNGNVNIIIKDMEISSIAGAFNKLIETGLFEKLIGSYINSEEKIPSDLYTDEEINDRIAGQWFGIIKGAIQLNKKSKEELFILNPFGAYNGPELTKEQLIYQILFHRDAPDEKL